MKRILGFALLLSMTACANTQTVGPLATPSEIALETEHHHNYLRESRAQGLVLGGVNKKAARPRVEAVAKRIAPAAIALCTDMGMADPKSCAYSIHIKRGAEDEPDAYTDGEDVFITGSMVQHTANDDELALVIAHEYAHIIMRHHDAARQNMLLGAMLGAAADAAIGTTANMKAGAEAGMLAYSPAFEREADYIGLYIATRAGYDYKKSTDFWRRMSLALPDSIYFERTHPTNPERYVVLNKTVAEISAKKSAKQVLIPEFKQDAAVAASAFKPQRK